LALEIGMDAARPQKLMEMAYVLADVHHEEAGGQAR